MGALVWWFLVLMAVAVYAGSRPTKKQIPQRTAQDIDKDPPSSEQVQEPISTELTATVDIEDLLCKEPMWHDFKAQFDSDDWNQKRQFLQKIAYGIAAHPRREQDVFKLFMTVFAESDPLYRLCLAQLLPVVTATPGIKQTDLYGHMPAAPDVELARYVLYFAHELGEVVRVKKGRTYQVYPADKNHSALIKIGLINRLGYGHKLPPAMQGIDVPSATHLIRKKKMEISKNLAFAALFNRAAGPDWESSLTFVSAQKAHECLWLLMPLFTPHRARLATLTYDPRFEPEADQALLMLSLGEPWTEASPSPGAWRVLYERQLQSIIAAKLNEEAGVQNFMPVPVGLADSDLAIAAAVFLQWSMKLLGPPVRASGLPDFDVAQLSSLRLH